ncbi:hypothetical protein NO2_1219 [Candidatus Termititenax persephonae]|uniref:Uncharacterized protein n=1 Tax=Candidatus Termititenax persephonae TaxID=2218525 RepID=A0A388THS1_9BACT|nr:hypothetical protein NO2_1219 [Candidatus Termititenax persephonae]
MRKLCLGLLLSGFLLALEVTGPQEVFTLERNQSARLTVVLNNPGSQPAAVKVSYFLDQSPDDEQQRNYLTLLDSLQRRPEVALAPNSYQNYTWEIRTAADTAYGEYLFWVVFSVDSFTQNSDDGDFVVQDVSYFPVRLNCVPAL